MFADRPKLVLVRKGVLAAAERMMSFGRLLGAAAAAAASASQPGAVISGRPT